MLSFRIQARDADDRARKVRFLGLDSHRIVWCEVTRTALEKLAGKPLFTPLEMVQVFDAEKKQLYAAANRLYRAERASQDRLTIATWPVKRQKPNLSA